MKLDLDKLKQQLSAKNPFAHKQAEEDALVSQEEKALPKQPEPAQPTSRVVADAKQGFRDIKRVMEEGNYRLFVKQLVILLLVFLGVRFLNDKLSQQRASCVDQISAISIQQTNEQDYLENKSRLLQLEPAFPDIANKNEWLLRKIMDALESHQIQANISGNVSETAGTDYTVVAQPVTFQQEFFDLGRFVADIENGDDFLRISELSISKPTDPALLGKNIVNIRFNTLFPKEKYGPKLFKDYAKRMQELKAAQESASQAAKSTEKVEKTEQAEETSAEENANAL